MELWSSPSRFHQHLWSQVWSGLCWPGLGAVERRGLFAQRPHLRASYGFRLFICSSISPSDFGIILDYLGSTEYTFTLLACFFFHSRLLIWTGWFTRNFSKPAAPVFAQMFNFLNLGFEGYKKIAHKDLRNARLLSRALESTYFTVRINHLSPYNPIFQVI